MRATWALCALWALFAHTTAEPCPAHCACSVGDEQEYICTVGAHTITITARAMDYVNVDCEGAPLSCSTFPSLPIGGNRTLPSLWIRDCSLPDPLQCIARRVSATGVQLLGFRNVKTELQERHVEGLGVEKLVLFDAGAQKSVPVQALSTLPTLNHFRLCGGTVQLTEQPFELSPALTFLELTNDDVTSLPASAFAGLKALKTLTLWKNNISYVDEEAFQGLDNLQDLSIGVSGLGSLPARLFANTPRLSTVKLVRNRLSALPGGLFHGLQQLRQVEISNDVPLQIQPHAFSNLPSLSSIKLDQSSIPSVPKNFITNCSAVLNLTLVQNNIESLPPDGFEGLSTLQRLDLSYNKIKKLTNNVFVSLKSLKELKMDGNLIEELPEQIFTGLRHLETLSISKNRLHLIPASCFQGCDSILHLHLARNLLTLTTNRNNQYYNLEFYSPFNTLLRLQTLDLSYNQIDTVFDDWRNVLLDLRELDLSHNRFGEITAADVQFLSSEITLDFRHNNITTILLSPAYSTGTKTTILLDDNPLSCDCRLFEAKRLTEANTRPYLDLNGTYCASPSSLQGIPFANVSIDELICDINCSNCECQIHPARDSLNVDCFNYTELPNPLEYGLSHSEVRFQQMPTDLTILPDYVTVLNLSNLGLKTVPNSVPKSLEILDLSHNKLEEFPIRLLKQNLSLKLSGNTFICDCGTVQEIALMTKFSSKIIDFQNLKCKDGSYMWKLEVDKLCLVQKAALLGGVLATFGLILAASAVLIHRYSIEIRVFLTNRGLLCCLTDEYDTAKKYDVFVSFSHEDEVFVIEKLLPKLEVNYRVCVHHRDWRVGDLIPAQIARSVEESKRTLIVLSRKFLESTWGMLEFRAAHVQAAKEKKVRVIVLLLEDLTNVELDRELQAYLTTNTYVKWGDPWFWEKLQYALPRKTKAKDIRDEKRVKMAAELMAKGGLQVTLNAEGKLVNNALNKQVM